jgi:hypothetical protein
MNEADDPDDQNDENKAYENEIHSNTSIRGRVLLAPRARRQISRVRDEMNALCRRSITELYEYRMCSVSSQSNWNHGK